MYSYEWLREQARKFGVSLSDYQIGQFKRYAQLLGEEKEKFNLTAADWDRLIPDHFLDSLSTALGGSFVDRNRVVDIGSGAGFPGIPLKIAFPGILITLVESRRKRAEFLRNACLELELKDASVFTERAEAAGRDPGLREKNNLVVARAVADLRVLLEYALPLLTTGGLFIALKGPKGLDEASAAKNTALVLGGKIKKIIPVNFIPDRVRNLVIIEKIAATPARFPRRAGMPSKRPLNSDEPRIAEAKNGL